MFTLYIANKNYSSWSLRPWILMTQLDIPFQEELSVFKEGTNWDEFRDFSPSGKVPCLNEVTSDGQNINVWDSLAIIEYLAEQNSNVWPSSRQARTWARCASAEMHSGFFALRDKAMSCGVRVKVTEISAELQHDLSRVDELWNEGLNRFGGPFLAGKEFSAVDAFYAPVVFRLNTYGLPISDKAAEYVERILKLKGMQQWMADALQEPWRELAHEQEISDAGIVLHDYRK